MPFTPIDRNLFEYQERAKVNSMFSELFQASVSGGGIVEDLLRDTSQRPLVTRRANSGAISTASYANGANRVASNSQQAVAIKNRQGIVWNMRADAAAVGYAGRVFSIRFPGVAWRWDSGAGWRTTGWTFTFLTQHMLFVDSRGNIYYCNGTIGTGTAAREIWRSTDGGVTFSVCLTLPGTQDSPAPMCEDDLGSLYVPAYGNATVGAPDNVDRNVQMGLNSRTLWKSADGGATWANISAGFPLAGGFTGAASIQRHLHGVFWDDTRKLLFVTHGDASAGSPILVSSDRGATFSAWNNTRQATAMAFTAGSVIYGADQSTDGRIYRCNCGPGCSFTSLLGLTPTPALDWTTLGVADNTIATTGFCWNATVFPSGALVFPFVTGTAARLVASVDDGVTWTMLDSTAGGGSTYKEQYSVSWRGNTWDGYMYGLDLTLSSVLTQLSVHKIGATLTVNAATGSIIGDGVRTPMRRYLDGQPINAVVQQLTADYPEHITATANYSIFDSNGYALGSIGTLPVINETWEGALAGWTNAVSSGGVTTQGATNRAKNGTKSLLCDLTAGSGSPNANCRKTITTTVDGDELWASADTYFEALAAPNNEFFELNVARTFTINANQDRWQLGVSGNFYSTVGFVPPVGAWVHWKLALRIHPTDGRIRFWVDTGAGYRLAIDVEGVSTRGVQYTTVGFKAVSTTLTRVNHDNCAVCLNGDPDIGGPFALTNTLQAAIREGVYV
jgi:hypothetical protein